MWEEAGACNQQAAWPPRQSVIHVLADRIHILLLIMTEDKYSQSTQDSNPSKEMRRSAFKVVTRFQWAADLFLHSWMYKHSALHMNIYILFRNFLFYATSEIPTF